MEDLADFHSESTPHFTHLITPNIMKIMTSRSSTYILKLVLFNSISSKTRLNHPKQHICDVSLLLLPPSLPPSLLWHKMSAVTPSVTPKVTASAPSTPADIQTSKVSVGESETFACPWSATSRCLPLVSFNHITREVKDLRASENFYCSLLGFRRIARPDLSVEGVWVFHDQASISVHLLQGNPPPRRWSEDGPLENRDHVNFLTPDINLVEVILRQRGTFYHKVVRNSIGIVQVFVADPDGNVIEIGSCAPPPDEIVCAR